MSIAALDAIVETLLKPRSALRNGRASSRGVERWALREAPLGSSRRPPRSPSSAMAAGRARHGGGREHAGAAPISVVCPLAPLSLAGARACRTAVCTNRPAYRSRAVGCSIRAALLWNRLTLAPDDTKSASGIPQTKMPIRRAERPEGKDGWSERAPAALVTEER